MMEESGRNHTVLAHAPLTDLTGDLWTEVHHFPRDAKSKVISSISPMHHYPYKDTFTTIMCQIFPTNPGSSDHHEPEKGW